MADVTEVAEHVHRFDASGSNVYVIVGDGGLTVVDAGFPGHWRAFSTWLHRSGRSPREVVAVLLTHHHADHVGFADRAQDEGADLHIHAEDLDAVQRQGPASIPDRFARQWWHPGVARRLGAWVRRGVTSTPALQDVTPCADGDQLDVPGNPRVLHVPGHTAGSAAYVFEDHGVVCTGDALVTRDPATGRPGVGIAPSGLNADDAQALASLDRFEDLEATLLPGHGEPYSHGVAGALHAARAIGASW